MISNDITIRLGVDFLPRDEWALARGGTYSMAYAVADWEAGVSRTKSDSLLDRTVKLPTLTNGAAAFVKNAPAQGAGGVDLTKRVYDDDSSGPAATNNKILDLGGALVKAIGGTPVYAANNGLQLDGGIEVGAQHDYDFDPSDGTPADKFDFVGIATSRDGARARLR
ncbi:hypothetical protein ACT009_05025 [Sphingomonas sp. Tas61C01]|uniref:hypothetical protein n=1 Tax=Sphingomonas sp. Tas61C01 TaxID=3458297 RepID=UPI00403E82BD